MRSFALTYPQLMQQAVRLGLGERDLVRLRRAHELAQGLTDGLYRKQSVPFLCHLIRTASITLAELPAADVVVASLLHAVYFLHVFEGSRRRGPRRTDRELLRGEIGSAAEELITRYGAIAWHDADVLEGYAALQDRSPETRGLLLMALANELEDRLDAGEAYAGDGGGAAPEPRHAAACLALAEGLGHHELACDLREAFDLGRAAAVAPSLRTGRTGSYEATRLWEASPLERLGSWLRRQGAWRGRR
jgi:hypothetical protein